MSSKSKVLCDVKDAQCCKDINENTCPLVLFFDEIETGNPLESHKIIQKIGVFYASLRCFPTHMYSKSCNIYPYIFIPSLGVEYKYMHQIWENVVGDIK